MTRFRSPDMPRVLVFGSGNVKDQFFSLSPNVILNQSVPHGI